MGVMFVCVFHLRCYTANADEIWTCCCRLFQGLHIVSCATGPTEVTKKVAVYLSHLAYPSWAHEYSFDGIVCVRYDG